MFRRLTEEHSRSGVEIETPVCIVGGGTGGLFLAHLLNRKGVRVVVLEAGEIVARPPSSFGEVCEQSGRRYRGAEDGRSFGLGGTSVVWGGQLIGMTEHDFSRRPGVPTPWPIPHSEVAPFFPVVFSEFGIPPRFLGDESAVIAHSYPSLSKMAPPFHLRLSSWIPFSKRNVAKAFARSLRRGAGIDVWLDTCVTDFVVQPTGSTLQLVAVRARSPAGTLALVKAGIFVFCAGALETTRLVLLMDRHLDGEIARRHALLGRFFSDHLSVTCGEFHCTDRAAFNSQVAPIFRAGVMRTPRLELSAECQRRWQVPSAFAHFTFKTCGNTGFDAVRQLLRRRQGGEASESPTRIPIRSTATEVAALALWRIWKRRLRFPREATLLLQVDIEQRACASSRLELSDETDHFGRQRLHIDWKILPEDWVLVRRVAEQLAASWEESPLASTARLELEDLGDEKERGNLYDVYHPTGTLRMGNDPADSVVDPNLRLWSVDNCYINSTAVFPSAGSANPGLTHLALTARLAEHIAARRRPAGGPE